MRTRTASALVAVFCLLGVLAVSGVGLSSNGQLVEQWVSDTPRDNEVNHHAVGVGPAGDVVVAPVAELPNSDVPITNTSCSLVRLAPENGTTVWQTGMPAEACFTHALTEPTIEDADGDGSIEVFVSSTENALVTYDAATGTEEWRVPLATYGYGRPTLADVTEDSSPEVVTSDIRGNVVVASGDGAVRWRFSTSSVGWSRASVWAAPIVTDIDDDGAQEVLVGTSKGVVLLTGDGDVDWVVNGSATYTVAAQADDDSAVEVFTGGTSTLRAYDGSSGELQWERELSNPRIRTAADTDSDGTVELFVGRADGRVRSVNARTGETEWSTKISESDDTMIPPPVLGDVDGTSGPEVIAVTNSGTVAVLDAESGSEMAAYEREVPVWTVPTPADLDGDGDAEVLVRYGDGRVVALDYAGGSDGIIPELNRVV
jgi:outer membrane protein assembly factor BamB